MKIGGLIALVLFSPCWLWARTETQTLDDLLQSGEQFLKENVDENVLRLLQEVDRTKVRQFLRDLQQQLQGEYVIDLAKLKATVDHIANRLPAETQMYVPKINATLFKREGTTLAKLAAPGRGSSEKR
jgi:hypothetical protein